MNKLLTKSSTFLKKNSSLILTGFGAAGVVVTAVLANNAGTKASKISDDCCGESARERRKCYIPVVLSGAATIACIVGAEITNRHRQASLVSAYAALGTVFNEYKQKVNDLYGENANPTVREAIVKDHCDCAKVEEADKMLFFDFNSMQYFESTMADVFQAEYNLNRQMALTGSANIFNFYEELGVPVHKSGRSIYDEVWTIEPCKWIEFTHDFTTLSDGLECCIISMPQNRFD